MMNLIHLNRYQLFEAFRDNRSIMYKGLLYYITDINRPIDNLDLRNYIVKLTNGVILELKLNHSSPNDVVQRPQ